MFSLGLAHRRLQPAIMAQPDLNERDHVQALRALERINLLSGSARILRPPIRDVARFAGSRPLRILDFVSGAGDFHAFGTLGMGT